jgi:ubiquinone/menaquinone biosynthesis C-methylase UbiE
VEPQYDLLCCPHDHFWPLTDDGGGLRCPRCDREYPVRDGYVSFLTPEQMSEQDRVEQAQRDAESSWYDAMFEGYTNAVEVPTAVRRVGHPEGPLLDAGCGTGRITEALLRLGQPVVAVDYSGACLRRMLDRTAGAPVVAVQADLRSLPVRSGSIHGATCIEVYSQLRGWEFRDRFLAELHRVMAAGAALSVSAFNYNLLFRAWKLAGNDGAREGEHMLGGDYYYFRFTREEFRRELATHFEVEEVTGVRNIPARSLAAGVRKLGAARAADRFMDFMVERGHKADYLLERTPVSWAAGFFWLAKAVKRP